MRRLFAADIHFSSHYFLSPSRNKYKLRLVDSIRCMIYLLQQCIVNNIDQMWIVGDILHQSGSRIPFSEIILLRNLLSSFPCEVYIVGGNHDISDNIWVIELLSSYNTTIITEPSLYDDIFAIPYGFTPEIRANINLWHGMVRGAVLSNNYKALEGEEISFSKDCVWLLGHVHKHQQLGNNAWYIGSPYRINFSEEFNEPYICLIDNAIKWIKTLLPPKFITINIDTQTIDSLSVEDCYIRLQGDNLQRMKELQVLLKSEGARSVLLDSSKSIDISQNIEITVTDPLELLRDEIEANIPEKDLRNRILKIIEVFQTKGSLEEL